MSGLVTAKALREKRANLGKEAQAIIDKAETEKRDLSAEEKVSFDKIHTDIEEMRTDVERLEKHERVTKELGESRGVVAGRENAGPDDSPTEDGKEAKELRAKQEKAFRSYLRFGMEGLEPEERAIMSGRFSREKDSPVNEQRTAQTVTTSGGGYLIPQGFGDSLEKSMKAFGGVESASTAFSTETGNTLPWPTVDDTSNTGRLLAINTAATETALAFGVITFAAYKFSSDMVTIPVELLQDSAFDLDTELAAILGERLGRVHNTYQTTGTGSSQPQGNVVGASSGVTAAGTTTVTADELLDLVHSVDPAYRTPAFGAGWFLNDGSLKKLRQLKDGEGRPLWQVGIAGSAPDSILGYPYTINQDMAAMTTGLKPILFGARKKFRIRNVKGFTLLRLAERYAELHQVAFLAFTRMDSHVMDAGTDPLKYITMG
jgi:HK97 family phage major capsid protein